MANGMLNSTLSSLIDIIVVNLWLSKRQAGIHHKRERWIPANIKGSRTKYTL